MRTRIILYAAVLAVLAGTIWIVKVQRRWNLENSKAVAAAQPRPYLDEKATIAPRPDARILMALADIDRVLGAGHATWDAKPLGEGWQIERDSLPVDTIRSYPPFETVFHVLLAHAVSVGARDRIHGASHLSDPPADAPSVQVAHEADLAWAKDGASIATLRQGTAALTDLAMLSPDEVGVADPLQARGLALAALCEAVAPGSANTEIALIAEALGYRASAWRRAEALPADDPARAFILRDDAALEAMAGAPHASRRARQLHLVRLARSRDAIGWTRWIERGFGKDRRPDWALLATGITLHRFETHVPLGQLLLAGLSDELQLIAGEGNTVAGAPDGSLAEAMDLFETKLASMDARADGVFLDRAVVAACYRDSWYSSLFTIGQHLRESLNSVPATIDFAEALGTGGAPHAAEFRLWYRHLADLDATGDFGPLANDLRTLRHFGAPLLHVSALELLDRLNELDTSRRFAIARVAEVMDQRPANREGMGWMVRTQTHDIVLAETMFDATFEEVPPHDSRRGWWAAYSGDRAGMERILAEPTLPPYHASQLLGMYAAMPGVDSAAVDTRWREAMQRYPNEWSLAGGFAKRLRGRGDLAAARRLVRDWRAAQQGGPKGFDDILSRTDLAESMQLEGRLPDALATIRPAAASMQGGALARCAKILQALGRTREADSVAATALARYPNSPALTALLTGQLWRRDRMKEAAELLLEQSKTLPNTWWAQYLWPEFRDALIADHDRAQTAVAMMNAVGVPWWAASVGLGDAAAREGHAWLALELAKHARTPGRERAPQAVCIFESLSEIEGPEQASRWLRSTTQGWSATDRSVLTFSAYEMHQAEPIWLIDPDSSRPDDVEFSWLLRTADVIRRHDHGEHRRAVEAWFDAPGQGRYHVFGRYLLGRASEQEVLAQLDGRRSRCEAYYYIGLRHDAEGRYRDAAQWYVRSLETRDRMSGEYHWALSRLSEWTRENMSLEMQARRDAARRAGESGPKT
jgi:tetratricopeptide (TPR) repeat protein